MDYDDESWYKNPSDEPWYKNPSNYWIRWVLLIPIVLFIYGFVIYLIENISSSDDFPTWVINYIISPFATLLGSFSIIVVGSVIAPKSKKTIALILFTIVIIFESLECFFGMKTQSLFLFVRAGAGIIGGFMGYLLIEDVYKKK